MEWTSKPVPNRKPDIPKLLRVPEPPNFPRIGERSLLRGALYAVLFGCCWAIVLALMVWANGGGDNGLLKGAFFYAVLSLVSLAALATR
jgi:hypothetical protein